ncbi:MAG: class I SAM-dependent methyltransferase [Victivallaceae bacterium]|nr:class I SAM-dependent methyltransferase [Victivallaceae bacterium]
MDNGQEVIQKFWRSRGSDATWLSGQRLFANINWIIPKVQQNTDVIMDIGAGSGELTMALALFLDFKKCHLLDINENLLNEAGKKIHFINPKAQIYCNAIDISDLKEFSTVDLCLCLGVIIYLLDDDILRKFLAKINCKQLFLRAPCTLKDEDEEICTYSEALQAKYAAKYRTVNNTVSIIEEFFAIKEYGRVFPDSIESKFGTKQYMFNCLPRG